jgi:Domain of unknown function (DUF4824)
MKPLTQRRLLWLGLALIAAVNAIALGGAAWNRSAIESSLALGEREFHVPYSYGPDAEDSSVALALGWQVEPGEGKRAVASGWYLNGYGLDRSPAWLDQRKLAELGFGTIPPAAATTRAPRERERPVVLVLELDGPAYQRFLAQAAASATKARSEAAAKPTDKEAGEAALNAERQWTMARDRASRLFVVDAGRDADALRLRYPDRHRYAMLRGIVTVNWARANTTGWRLSANVERLLVPAIQLSRGQALALGTAARPTMAYDDSPRPPFRAELVIGRRLEPWVASLRRP